ncbi:MAG: hypothetical protein ACLFNZ_08860 [Spirochaetaceae bacterium]
MKTIIDRYSFVPGFAVLTFFVLLLVSLSFVETFNHALTLSLLKGIVLLGLLGGVYSEWKHTLEHYKGWSLLAKTDVYTFFAVFGGAVVTFFINVELAHGAVIASGIVGILAAAVFGKKAVPVFCGSFVGMASPSVFSAYPCIIIAGTIAGIVFVLSRHIFNGYGGKLGTIAFSACIMSSLMLDSPLQRLSPPGWNVGWIILVYSIMGAVITFSINVRLGHGPVMASAIVGLTAGLILPALHGPELGETLAVMVFCASFAGMSGTGRFENELPIAAAGFLCGIIFIYSAPYMGGAGGKLGTIALASVVCVRGWMDILPRYLGRRSFLT